MGAIATIMRVSGLLAFAMMMALSSASHAQDAGPEAAASETEATDRIQKMKEALEARETKAVAPDVVSPDVLGPEGTDAMRAAFKAYYDYRVQGFSHRQGVFEWQLLSSKIIFGLVVLIVMAGIYFSWMQFHAGLKSAESGGLDKETTLEASATGIKVSSPVLGVIILALSLAFFYLYLVHVYPIEEIF